MIEKALFGAGCFWGVEETFRKLSGVKSTSVGYSGGNTTNPTYESICKGNTNHAEVVLIDFDNEIISYQNLLDHFWKCHDPTTLNRQGPDIGTQYRSIIFFYDNNQKKISEESRKFQSENNNMDIVTEIVEAQDFYKAEEYHQKYIQKTGLNCAI
tara:strand:+ start:216 stop:680 length:465 start_codon:yes stop_codon:yes gene_type:complete